MATSWPSMRWHGPAVSEADVAGFEAQLGHALPEDYRRFLLEVNGGRLAMENKSFRYGNVNMLFSLNAADEGDDLLTWALHERSTSALPSRDLLFVGYDDGGGLILVAVAGEHRGEVWFENRSDPRPEGSNPRVLWFDRRDMKKLADSFEQFMGTLKPLDTGA